MTRVVFRVDASIEIGSGHYRRCLTLAEALLDKGVQVAFVSQLMPDLFEKELLGLDIPLYRLAAPSSTKGQSTGKVPGLTTARKSSQQDKDATQTIALLKADHSCDWIVVDNYALDARWEKKVKVIAKKVMVIDDQHNRKHNCDLLLDQNIIDARKGLYNKLVPEKCLVLLGPRYSLLRREFKLSRNTLKRKGKGPLRLLVSFGGSDPLNYTMAVVKAIKNHIRAKINLDVAVGSQNPKLKVIKNFCTRQGYKCHVQTPNFSRLMADADLAIGTGGAELWERCCMGTPTLVICTASNQAEQIKQSAAAGIIYAPDESEDPEAVITTHLPAILSNTILRQQIGSKASSIVDSLGVDRVVSHMKIDEVTVREMTLADCELIYKWRNSSEIRESSSNNASISPDKHRRWFKKNLDSQFIIMLMGLHCNQPYGAVRYDIEKECAVVSIYLDPKAKGVGLGGRLLECSDEWLKDHYPRIERIHAKILSGNIPSMQMFKNRGYQQNMLFFEKKLGSL